LSFVDLPHNVLLYALLLVAVGAGYLLGRKDRKRPRPQEAVIQDYYHGLNFLLGEQPELGVDRFIDAMEVSDGTVDVHLAMAGVVRRRGELDKAIRIHQNLLASPVLNDANKQLVELELARDYHTGGLWDRAENLLDQIVRRKGSQEMPALELLLDLYEQEREWQQAIDISAKLVKSNAQMRTRVGHFHCELAEVALAATDFKQAMSQARKAVEFAPTEARGHWLLARLEAASKNYRRVLRHVQKAVDLAPELVGEYLAVYRSACENLNNDKEYERFLRNSLKLYPDPKLLSELIEFRRMNGDEVAVDDLVEEIARAPSFGHLPLLMDLGQRQPEAAHIRAQISNIVALQSGYQCTNCGFTTPHVLWHCPGCRSWGSFGAAGRFKAAASQ
jgi:lipopolysaccharide biosynthesis regulator YciM